MKKNLLLIIIISISNYNFCYSLQNELIDERIYCGSALNLQNNYLPQTGDIFFQDGNKTDFNEAIKNVTTSWEGRNFSHCGICWIDSSKKKPEIYIIEAIPDVGVTITPFNKFLLRCIDNKSNPKVSVGRLNDSLIYMIPSVIERAKSVVGAKYDYAFNFYNNEYYCSELVYFSYIDKNGKNIFDANPMTFINPESNKTDDNWIDYFGLIGSKVPEGELGVNPGGLSLSNKLKMLYSYY
jgi:uncharacterized protein YycO